MAWGQGGGACHLRPHGYPPPTPSEYSSDHQAADMAEIDARLKALQEYMNRLDTRS